MNRLLAFFDRLIEQHKAVRRTLVLWAAATITLVTYEIVGVLRKMEEITTPVVSFYLGVTALLTVVITYYQWSRERDAADKSRPDEVREADDHPAGAGRGGGRPDVPVE